MGMLDEVLDRLRVLTPEEKAALTEDVLNQTRDMVWIPTPGPQTQAYFCEADELFYGGSAGGGKSDLLLGLALTQQSKSLILRRYGDDARDLSGRIENILGHTNGRNAQLLTWNVGDHFIKLSGCQYDDDKQRYKGKAHDFYGFDEIGDFTESQFRFIKTWNRSTKEGQRCRVVCAGNPPTNAEGLWVIAYWGAWLDPKHPNPAQEGELRWYLVDENDRDIEVDGPGPYPDPSDATKMVRARSRTFIRARLSDNPYLSKTDYGATLDALPAALRAAYRDGRFDLSLEDDPWQVVPTSWILAAQNRWKPQPPPGVPMCAIAADPAQGGKDNTAIASRYDGWYDRILKVPGEKTPLGSDVAALVLGKRRDGAAIIVDMGGGYGGGVVQSLEENKIEHVAYKGSEATTMRDKSGKLGFKNKRSCAYWKFREALDPDQPGGSPIALPDSPTLVADLTAPRYKIEKGGIKITPKEDLCESLGRSPDEGDAVVMAWIDGAKNLVHGFHQGNRGKNPQVVMGHQDKRVTRR